jgi:hypothetical protein
VKPRNSDILVRVAIVSLTLSTAYIHSTLGGGLYTLNAIGYVAGAAAMIAPFAITRRYRWFIRLGLAGYAVTTIVAWAVQGPYYMTAYLAKAIELALVTLLVIDFARGAGNPVDRVRDEIRSILGRPHGPLAGRA